MQAAQGKKPRNLVDLLTSEEFAIKPLFQRNLALEAVHLDLSRDKAKLSQILQSAEGELDAYIAEEIHRLGGTVGVGGYAEERAWYQRSSAFFEEGEPRTVHLGVDVWIEAGTAIFVPLDAKIHSFADNAAVGDYGPTIILEHELAGLKFHSLYGHLSAESLEGKEKGMQLRAGDKLAEVGASDVNGCWPPHLHLQLIIDLEGKEGDYPGVSTRSMLPHYLENCPDPNLFLRLEQLSRGDI